MPTDREMMDRIAKLSTAIQQQKSGIRGGKGGGLYMPGGRGGGYMSLNNTAIRPNNTNVYNKPYARPSSTPVTISSHNRQLVLNGASATTFRPVPTTFRPPAVHAYRPPPTNTYRPPPTNTYRPPSNTYRPQAPIKKSQHRKLIINHKGNATTTNKTMVKSIDAATGRKQVAIDGIDFVVKGKKLIRKDIFDSNTTKSNFMTATTYNAPKVLIRRTLKSAKRRDKNQNMVLGKAPSLMRRKQQRSKGGNMVFTREPEGYVRQGRNGKSLILTTTARLKKPRCCGFFTRYGICPNGPRCPFQHDPQRRAICLRFLQGRCKQGLVCKLSHTPNQHTMPHCVHFQKMVCTNDPCTYIHVKVSVDAPVCKAFSMEGYCSKGLTCQEKHVHVCPEFAETGKCSNANCRLPHVAKRTTAKTDKASGIIRLGSWVSPQYFHAQKLARAEKRKAIEEKAASKVWTRPVEQVSKEVVREKEEQDGFVRLFDGSDDDGWSQYQRNGDANTLDFISLRFNDEEEEEEEEEDEDEAEEDKEGEGEDDSDEEDDSDVEEVYEEVSDTNMSDEEEE